MIRINLLPLRAKKRKVTVRHFFLAYMGTVAVTVALIGGIWIYQEARIHSLNSQLGTSEGGSGAVRQV